MKTKDKPKTTEPNDMPTDAYHWVWRVAYAAALARSEEHTSELQSQR